MYEHQETSLLAPQLSLTYSVTLEICFLFPGLIFLI